ncbi:MAG: hypothetical protein IPN15_14475 [Saprospiraceae bacterium]|nr:hypothetical protein [Candidatus Vicinibacter affinis]
MKYYEGVQRNISEYIPGFQNYETYPLTPNNYRKILELKSVKNTRLSLKQITSNSFDILLTKTGLITTMI